MEGWQFLLIIGLLITSPAWGGYLWYKAEELWEYYVKPPSDDKFV